MTSADGTIDEAQLAELSRRIGIPARQLVIAAARLAASPDRANDPEYLARILRDARDASPDADAAARLVTTPFADYATNEVDRLFETIWPARRQDE